MSDVAAKAAETENRLPLYRRPCCIERVSGCDADPDANRSAGLHSYRVDLVFGEATKG